MSLTNSQSPRSEPAITSTLFLRTARCFKQLPSWFPPVPPGECRYTN